VLPLLAEFDPGHSTSVDSAAPATLSTSACVSDAVVAAIGAGTFARAVGALGGIVVAV